MSRVDRRIDPAHGPTICALMGEYEHPDFSSLLVELQAMPELSLTEESDQADWVLLFAARPGSISQSDVEAIFARIPAVRTALVTGSHCEGELRSGRPVQGIERWRWWETRFRLLAALRSTAPVRTESPVERMLRSLPQPAASDSEIKVVVMSSDREAGGAIIDLLRGLRFKAFAQGNAADPADVVVWCDADFARPELIERARAARETHPAAGAIAVIDFPRSDELTLARSLGFTHVLGRPFFAADLACAVREAAAKAVAVRTRSHTQSQKVE